MSSSHPRLQVTLSARGLKNIAGFLNTSDPFAVVTIRGDNPDNRPVIAGQTEVFYNNLDPQWATVIFIDGYKFGVPFYIEVGVFDFQAKQIGKSERDLATQSSDVGRLITTTESTRNLLRTGKLPYRLMGTALFEVGDVVGQRGNQTSKKLQSGGQVFVRIERSRNDGASGRMKLQLRAIGLANAQSFGKKSSPFFELYRKVEQPTGATWTSVFRSNVVRKDLSPKWEQTVLSLEAACNGDMDRSMKVIVYDHRRSGGKHKVMGEFETTMRGFLECKSNGGDIDEDLGFKLLKHGKEVGSILVLKAALAENIDRNSNDDSRGNVTEESPRPSSNPSRPISQKPDFVDYLAGGCSVSLAVAVDFTASNGNPRQEGTPHFFHPPPSNEWNDYQKAMYAVGSILAKYDTDQMFPVWGFGAKYNGVVRHCFQCGEAVEVQGVHGIMDAYRGVFNSRLTMSSPTVFTEVIRTAAGYAQHEQQAALDEGKLSYTILLILTVGSVEDIQATKSELIEASETPLSVVIVGIGDKDFEKMQFLDEHDPATEGGRDITKFVKFNDFKSYNLLTEAVLDEIPGQLVDYFFDRGIMPGKAEQVGHDEVTVMEADADDRTTTFLG